MPRKPGYDRDALIDQARDLFWKQGWAGTSLKDLERTLGLNPGSFYAAFGSKDALYELALDRYAAGGAQRLRALADEYGPLAALQRFPALAIDPSSPGARACMLAKTLLEVGDRNPKITERANAHLSAMENLIADLFRAAQDAGQISRTFPARALARRYQSDLLGLRITAERDAAEAGAIAAEIADGLAGLSARAET